VDFEYCKASKLFCRIRTQAPLKVFCHLRLLTLDTEGHQTSPTLFYQLLIGVAETKEVAQVFLRSKVPLKPLPCNLTLNTAFGSDRRIRNQKVSKCPITSDCKLACTGLIAQWIKEEALSASCTPSSLCRAFLPHFPTLAHTYPLLGLSKLFFSFPSARAIRRTEKLTRRDLGSSTYPPLNMAPDTLLHLSFPPSSCWEHSIFGGPNSQRFQSGPEDLLPICLS
jgi:hypothetical protein